MKTHLQPLLLLLATLSVLNLNAVAADDPIKPKDADNTAKNERDRNGDTKTPLDQSNKEEHLKITQNIRKAVMADDSLSMNAKNVKIITTADGQVTLRGAVNTNDEKDKIAALAKQHAGTGTVVNQIEVKAAKSQ